MSYATFQADEWAKNEDGSIRLGRTGTWTTQPGVSLSIRGEVLAVHVSPPGRGKSRCYRQVGGRGFWKFRTRRRLIEVPSDAAA